MKHPPLPALLLCALCLLLLSGCGRTGASAGRYELRSITLSDGSTLAVDQLPLAEGEHFSAALELKEDGTFSLSLSAMGEDQSMTGVWEAQDSRVLLTSGSSTLSATWADGIITLEQSEQTFTFQLSDP